jgi:hypothetical protein
VERFVVEDTIELLELREGHPRTPLPNETSKPLLDGNVGWKFTVESLVGGDQG